MCSNFSDKAIYVKQTWQGNFVKCSFIINTLSIIIVKNYPDISTTKIFFTMFYANYSLVLYRPTFQLLLEIVGRLSKFRVSNNTTQNPKDHYNKDHSILG